MSLCRRPPCCRRLAPARLLPVHRAALHSSSAAASPDHEHKHEHTLAILGGGLSGLATAHYFLRTLDPALRPRTRIVLLERQDRVGGWCRAVRIGPDHPDSASSSSPSRPGHGPIVFETGPRSIRPAGLAGWLTLDLAHQLGLHRALVVVPKSAPSARNRYLYLSPPALTLLPSSLPSALRALFTTPRLRRILPSLLLEPFRPRSPLHHRTDPNDADADESVDAFFARRFGRALADDMVSAMVHGIYAGDTTRLSVRAVFPQLWEAEREWGSVVLAGLFGGWARRRERAGKKPRSPFRQRAEDEERELHALRARLRERGPDGRELVERMEGASVWGIKGGIDRLTDTLRDRLRDQGVEFWMGEQGNVQAVEKHGDRWHIRTSSGAELEATHLVTTLPWLLPASLAPPAIPSTTVSVVNLAFPAPSTTPGADAHPPPLHPPGFGYLLPRSVPRAQNPHHALGVLFDSDVLPGVDDSAQQGLVKLTVLLGGSYWLDRGPPSALVGNHDALVAAALDTLALHLPRPHTVSSSSDHPTDPPPTSPSAPTPGGWPAPRYTFTSTHHDCIPQVPPGSRPAFRAFGDRLAHAGNVAVVGGGFAPVGINGAVKSAWEVGTAFARALGRQNSGGEGGEGGGGSGWVRDDEGEKSEVAGEHPPSVVGQTGTEMWQL